jgi:hypothetical protein
MVNPGFLFLIANAAVPVTLTVGSNILFFQLPFFIKRFHRTDLEPLAFNHHITGPVFLSYLLLKERLYLQQDIRNDVAEMHNLVQTDHHPKQRL